MLFKAECPKPQCMLCTLLNSTDQKCRKPSSVFELCQEPIYDSRLCCGAAHNAAALRMMQ